MQLIYAGKAEQNLPRQNFPQNFSLSVNARHYSNEMESLNFINKILISYVDQTWEKLNLPNEKALVGFVFDILNDDLTKSVLKPLDHNNFVVTFVPTNMNHLYQPLVMMVDGYVKKFSKRKTLMSAMLTKLSNSFMKGRSYMKLRSNSNSIAKQFIEPDDKHRRKKMSYWKDGNQVALPK